MSTMKNFGSTFVSPENWRLSGCTVTGQRPIGWVYAWFIAFPNNLAVRLNQCGAVQLSWVLVVAVSLICHGAVATSIHAEEIQWLRSAEQAANAAEKTGKPILVYVRSANCHYCDLMQSNVWLDPIAASTVMRDFVPLKLTREENPQAIEVLKIKGFPSTIIFSSDRRYVDRLDGYVDSERFMAAVGKMRTASDDIR